MSYTLEQFAQDCRTALKQDSGPDGLQHVREAVEKALADKAFINTYLGPDEDTPRKVLYEDPDLRFCILSHVYKGASAAKPHDHATSWAIYGQAAGSTEMTEYKIVTPAGNDEAGTVEPIKTYMLEPGNAVVYNIGQLHAPKREDETRLIRIEGMNLAGVKRDRYELA